MFGENKMKSAVFFLFFALWFCVSSSDVLDALATPDININNDLKPGYRDISDSGAKDERSSITESNKTSETGGNNQDTTEAGNLSGDSIFSAVNNSSTLEVNSTTITQALTSLPKNMSPTQKAQILYTDKSEVEYKKGIGKSEETAATDSNPSMQSQVTESDIVARNPEEPIYEGGVIIASPPSQACALSCTPEDFSLSVSPKRFTVEVTADTRKIVCQAYYKNEAYTEMNVEFEWSYKDTNGEECTFGIDSSRQSCAEGTFHFSTDDFVIETAFVSELHFYGLEENRTGTIKCLFRPFCCLTNLTTNDSNTFTQEETSELNVYHRPDYTPHLIAVLFLSFLMCLILVIALFLYHRYTLRVHSNFADLDRSTVRYKQMKFLTPPHVTLNDEFNSDEEGDRDSYSSFDSVSHKNETDV
ncbi:uncharacterized protein LOC136026131 [Artemia franciscana]|uniref:Uncharacterized protein n=1 Tax=Artemia franciscana TaxID=6661 RepID=A0AA88L732_ARTSF|nr:hypothetical protein QYM36_011812 [Artemia franciscana]